MFNYFEKHCPVFLILDSQFWTSSDTLLFIVDLLSSELNMLYATIFLYFDASFWKKETIKHIKPAEKNESKWLNKQNLKELTWLNNLDTEPFQ